MIGKFQIADRNDEAQLGEDRWLETDFDTPHVITIQLIKALDEWDHADDPQFLSHLASALAVLTAKCIESNWDCLESVDEVFDMDMSGIVVRWIPEPQ